MRGQSGQMVTEAILIIVILMAVTFTAANYFKSNELLKQVITGPWLLLAGMLEDGEWGAPAQTQINNPIAQSRHIVILGEPAQ
jgi:hypothetical protein